MEFIKIIKGTEVFKGFDINIYFEIIDKMIVFEVDKVIVTLLEGTKIEVAIE